MRGEAGVFIRRVAKCIIRGTERTNRAFLRHCTTSGGRVLETWRFVSPADAS